MSISSNNTTMTTADGSTGGGGDNEITQNRSTLKDFLGSIATLRGDLSNITAPPFVLSPLSTVELPQFWASRPDVLCAPAFVADDSNDGDEKAAGAKRMMKVVRWWVSSLRGQQYAGRDPADGVKKPLNAVLGEVFVARWPAPAERSASSRAAGSADAAAAAGGGGEIGDTFLVSEQVSHHPPVTACRVWNETAGVEAEGFTRQEITFSGGGVNIRQMGYALFRLTKIKGGGDEGETYLIPLPDVKVKGVLGGTPYPELGGKYAISCTSGWGASVEFTGKGFLGLGGGDKKHGVEARVFREGREKEPVYTLSGNWDSEFEIKHEGRGAVVETFDVAAAPVMGLETVVLEEQDPYETGRGWQGVRDALKRGDMQGVSDAKNVVEEGQREMRKQEEADGKTWESLFFKDVGDDPAGEALMSKVGGQWNKEQTVGVWKFDSGAWEGKKRPFRGGLRPDNKMDDQAEPTQKPVTNGAAAGGVAASIASKASARQDTSTGETADQNPRAPAESDPGAKVYPPIPPEQQQQEAEEARLEDGVGNMTVGEQTAVEEMLRDQFASAPAGKKK